MTTIIKFYRVNDAHGYMSNFSRHPIEIDGKTWPSSEHYFQAQKFPGTEHEETIRQLNSPSQAAKLGRDRALPLRPDWETAKDDVMRKACLAKFTQHLDIQSKLIATQRAELVEETTNDYYWGCGTDGTGKNKLGLILMEIRETLTKATLEEKT